MSLGKLSESQRIARAISTTADGMLTELGIEDQSERAHCMELALIELMARVSLHRVFHRINLGQGKAEDFGNILERRLKFIGRKLASEINRQVDDFNTSMKETH